jgi:sensor histidine kinase regulating citrate/malate metabolism
MKKILFGLAVLTALGLQAAENSEIKANMEAMRAGLQSIQDGFSYNNKSGILDGINKIKKANEMFHNEESSGKFLPENKKRLAKVSFLSTKTLNASLAEMEAYVEADRIIDASDSMSGVVHSCTRCHAIVRGW